MAESSGAVARLSTHPDPDTLGERILRLAHKENWDTIFAEASLVNTKWPEKIFMT